MKKKVEVIIIIMRTRNEIVMRIEKLKQKSVENANLIRKWERILRNYDKSNT